MKGIITNLKGCLYLLGGVVLSPFALADITPLDARQMDNAFINNTVTVGPSQEQKNTIGAIQQQTVSQIQSRDVDAYISSTVPKPETKVTQSLDERIQEALMQTYVGPKDGKTYGPFQDGSGNNINLPNQTTFSQNNGGYQIGLPNAGDISGLSGAGLRLVFPNRGNGDGGGSDQAFPDQIIQAPGVPASIQVKDDQIILHVLPPR